MAHMTQKIKVGILFGGKSFEHEVSLLSANNIINNLDQNKYDISLIAIDKEGRWILKDPSNFLADVHDAHKVRIVGEGEPLAISFGTNSFVTLSGKPALESLDVIFPVLHGICGEDGTVQGVLKLAGIPFVGASVLASSIGLDKDFMKRLMRDAGLPIAKFITCYSNSHQKITFEEVKEKLGVPFFVKPSNGGSSVGVAKINNEIEFTEKLHEAFQYDTKVLIEEFIDCRELELSVLGNETPIVSIPGEVVTKDEFYTYDAKYVDDEGTAFIIPAKLSQEEILSLQFLAKKTYQVLGCEGMARIDFFLSKAGKIYVNEINTIPGFTNMSMYPKLWIASGVPYSEILDKLISLAIERKKKEDRLVSSYSNCILPG